MLVWHLRNILITISFITIAIGLLYWNSYITPITNSIVILLMLVTIISTDDSTRKQIKSLDESTRILQIQERTSKIIKQEITPGSTTITDAPTKTPANALEGRKALLVQNLMDGDHTIFETDSEGSVLGVELDPGDKVLYEFDPNTPTDMYFKCKAGKTSTAKTREW